VGLVRERLCLGPGCHSSGPHRSHLGVSVGLGDFLPALPACPRFGLEARAFLSAGLNAAKKKTGPHYLKRS